MTEDEAKAWVGQRWNTDEVERLKHFRTLVLEEAKVQNLIAPSSGGMLWSRHITDSAQLIHLAPSSTTTWIDIGTGAGFPGLVAAILRPSVRLTLVEPRRRRAEFLQTTADTLGLRNVEILQTRAQQVSASSFDVISARAVASLNDLLDMTRHLRSASTYYLLPKGRSAVLELETLSPRCQSMFHVEQSITDPDSAILVGTGVM